MKDLQSRFEQYQTAQNDIAKSINRSITDDAKAIYRRARNVRNAFLTELDEAIKNGMTLVVKTTNQEHHIRLMGITTGDGMTYYSDRRDSQYCLLGVKLHRAESIELIWEDHQNTN